jgi:hypothetical protein
MPDPMPAMRLKAKGAEGRAVDCCARQRRAKSAGVFSAEAPPPRPFPARGGGSVQSPRLARAPAGRGKRAAPGGHRFEPRRGREGGETATKGGVDGNV